MSNAFSFLWVLFPRELGNIILAYVETIWIQEETLGSYEIVETKKYENCDHYYIWYKKNNEKNKHLLFQDTNRVRVEQLHVYSLIEKVCLQKSMNKCLTEIVTCTLSLALGAWCECRMAHLFLFDDGTSDLLVSGHTNIVEKWCLRVLSYETFKQQYGTYTYTWSTHQHYIVGVTSFGQVIVLSPNQKLSPGTKEERNLALEYADHTNCFLATLSQPEMLNDYLWFFGQCGITPNSRN